MTAASASDQGSGGVASVERALTIMEVFASSSAPLTLAEIARATGFYKSTVSRLLVSLETKGYVVRQHDGRYRVGAMAFRLGFAYERTHGLKAHLLPVLQQLVDSGSESPSFHVRYDAERRVCLLRLDSHHSTLDRVHTGDLLPLRQGAPGRVILACDGRSGALRHPLIHATYGERDPACAGVACPVFGPDGKLVGALSMSGPLDRFLQAAVERMSRQLVEAAITITRALGGDVEPLLRERAAQRKTPARADRSREKSRA